MDLCSRKTYFHLTGIIRILILQKAKDMKEDNAEARLEQSSTVCGGNLDNVSTADINDCRCAGVVMIRMINLQRWLERI